MASETLTLNVQGMTCAGCASRVEKALKALPNAEAVHVNVATGKAYITSPDAIADDASSAIKAAGYQAELQTSQAPAKVDNESEAAKRRAFLAIILTLPVFIMEMGGHLFPAFHHWQAMTFGQSTLWTVQFILTTAVVFVAGRSFIEVGLPLLFKGAPNMDSLVALGSLAAWGFSTLVLAAPSLIPESARHVYFEAAAVIISLILLGRWLEARARFQARSAMSQLMGEIPDTAFILKKGNPEEVPLAAVTVGDHVLLKPGARVPVDGVILEGASDLDESMLTGEPIPAAKVVGDSVAAGTINGAGVITFEATSVGETTLLSRIMQTVEKAQSNKLPIQSAADRVVAIFVPIVIAIAALAFTGWYMFGPEPTLPHALVAMVSVLIIACPCAMGLATPTSIMVASARGASLGLLFTKGDALQKLSDVDVLAFDKTGTLTKGTPQIAAITCAEGISEDDALTLAAAAESGSEHPVAHAFLDAAKDLDLPDVTDTKAHVGHGLTAIIDGQAICLGSLGFAEAQSLDLTEFEPAITAASQKGQTLIFLAKGKTVIALFALEDQLREDARALVASLKAKGIQTALISGDRTATAQHIGAELGIDHVHAEVLPIEKANHIERLQSLGTVAFVGDGINDAPALAQADVGIAMGEGTDIAMESADLVLMTSQLSKIGEAQSLSKSTMRNIRENLFWAFGYNALLIPVAAGLFYPWLGWQLSPMLGAGAMALSSLFVVMNALRLRGFQPE